MSDKKIIPFDSKTLQLMLSALVGILITVLVTIGVTVVITDIDTAQRNQGLSESL